MSQGISWSSVLVLGPDDSFLPVITRQLSLPAGRFWREVTGVAIHRRHGAWTHVYACALAEGARPVVHLVRILEGERLEEAVDWLAARSGAAGPLFVRPPTAPAMGFAESSAVAGQATAGPILMPAFDPREPASPCERIVQWADTDGAARELASVG